MDLQDIKEKDIREIADSEAVWERGVDYFHSGMVEDIWLEDKMISAKVSGSNFNEYTVKIWYEDDEICARCSCPYEGWACKHIVAVLYEFLKRKKDLLKETKFQDKKTIFLKEQLEKISKQNLIDIILQLIRGNKQSKTKLLERLASSVSHSGIWVAQYEEYWDTVDPILEDFNQYGGGSGEDEDVVYENLEKITKLFKEKTLSQEIKKEFIDNMFHYYDWGNSGLDDLLQETIFEVASTKADWEYIIEKLQSKEDNWRRKLIMDIYRDHLHDEEAYLKLRESKLHYGLDYYELSQFWYKKGNIEKAVEIAKQGIEKGEGRIIDLIEFLFKYYKNNDDYTTALKYLVLKFMDKPCFEVYKETKKFSSKEDWPAVEKEYINILKDSKKEKELAEIYLYKKEYDKVLNYVKKKIYLGYLWDDREKFADKLKNIYPKEILEFYQDKVQQSITGKTRKNYRVAVSYAKKVKRIYINILKDKKGWENYITSIRSKYLKYPALQEEFSRL